MHWRKEIFMGKNKTQYDKCDHYTASESVWRKYDEDPRMIRVWRFKDAPEEYRNLSKGDGHEDWLAVTPFATLMLWDEDASFGTEFQYHSLPSGVSVSIGSRATSKSKTPGCACDKTIRVWEFDRAPKELQALSTNGG